MQASKGRNTLALLACPFCREMYSKDEESTCPVCGVPLSPLSRLPADESEEGAVPEGENVFPFSFTGRGRGALLLLAVLGLVLFFLPWIYVTFPDPFVLSGFGLARRLGWVWGAGVSWFTLIPAVLSRRTIKDMRGARVIVGSLSAVSVVTAIALLSHPPQSRFIPVQFHYGIAFWSTVVVSLLAVLVGLRFGGSVNTKARKVAARETLH